MQGLMNDFLEAKRSFYGWDDETFRQKSENFHANVRKVKFRPQYHDVDHIGRYNCKNGTVVLDMEGTDVGSFHARGIAHELNHAFNYEKGKRMNLLDGKNLRKSAKKYNLLECGGSDCHHKGGEGRGGIITDFEIKSNSDLIKALKGEFSLISPED